MNCEYVVRDVLCGKKDKCEHKYSFSHVVKLDGKEVYGYCEKDNNGSN